MKKYIKKHPIQFAFYALMFSFFVGMFVYKCFSVSSHEKDLLVVGFACGAVIYMITVIVRTEYEDFSYNERKNERKKQESAEYAERLVRALGADRAREVSNSWELVAVEHAIAQCENRAKVQSGDKA